MESLENYKKKNGDLLLDYLSRDLDFTDYDFKIDEKIRVNAVATSKINSLLMIYQKDGSFDEKFSIVSDLKGLGVLIQKYSDLEEEDDSLHLIYKKDFNYKTDGKSLFCQIGNKKPFKIGGDETQPSRLFRVICDQENKNNPIKADVIFEKIFKKSRPKDDDGVFDKIEFVVKNFRSIPSLKSKNVTVQFKKHPKEFMVQICLKWKKD
ncbi:MAG: hypothetical protein QG583_11 [Patescibacteria group bacterium]|jgi:hypothetical protein|nr:hypothetical protein [Patescibacteria group bacterium]MDQ5954084.1 hypothetical protein [Patescibacteria group bacterium]